MNKKNNPTLTANDEIRDEAAEQATAEPVAAEPAADDAKQAETGTRVYCGPSVRNVARQYTVYAGEIPDALREFIRKHPAAGGLLVPVEKFAETRRKLEAKGTAEAVLYNKVKSEL